MNQNPQLKFKNKFGAYVELSYLRQSDLPGFALYKINNTGEIIQAHRDLVLVTQLPTTKDETTTFIHSAS